MSRVPVEKSTAWSTPDPARTILKPFNPGGGRAEDGRTRTHRILDRILALPEAEVSSSLAIAQVRFAHRHRDLHAVFETNFAEFAAHVDHADELSPERRLLIGACFTHEYSVEAAALCNPSIVPAPDQSNLAQGATRFILSLRAIGEGHISSIEFRSGVIDAGGHVEIEPPGRYLCTARHRAPVYEKPLFQTKLVELRAYSDVATMVMALLPELFTLEQLEAAIQAVNQTHQDGADTARATRTLHWLASSNYESTFTPESELSERVLFPAGPTESNGMEDARFVRFTQDDGTTRYFATYTAFDGYQILPQLIETVDFRHFRIATLNGESARNKGIALFPRKIGGRYAALARVDSENNFLMWSHNVRFWHERTLIQQPQFAWELMHIGNCGSPIETEAGWLVITHGVGALRQYALGAILLDLNDPTRVIGRLSQPLLEPAEEERDGYVPNVVYSCGAMIAGERLVLPYGFSDTSTRIATVRVADLLGELVAHR